MPKEEGTFKLSQYGLPPKLDTSVLLMTQSELVVITDILRDIVLGTAETKHLLKRIDDLEKPFKKNLNSRNNK